MLLLKILHFVISLTSLILVATGIFAQAPPSLSPEGQKKLAEQTLVNNLIFDARSQPPEIAADAMITIAESGRVKSITQKRAILSEAFDLADQAQYSARIVYGGYTDNPVWAEYNPLDLKIDGLSLRLRVIKALLKFDKTLARKRFLNDIPADLELPPLGCENAVRHYDVSDFYSVASSIFNQTYSAKERREPAFLFTVLAYVDRVTSPAQSMPAAKMIVDLKPTAEQLPFLTNSYVQALGKIKNDEYSFRISVSNPQGVSELINAVANTRPGDAESLIGEFRSYVMKHLNGSRCSDGLRKNKANAPEAKYELPNAIKILNDGVFKAKVIEAKDIEPMSITSTTWPYRYWEDVPGGDERLNAARKLRFKPTENREWYSEEEKLREDWQIMFDKFLLDLGMWTSEEEKSPEDYFNKKSIIYFSLIEDIAPRGSAWDAVLKDYVLFLRQNELRGKSRLQWYWHVRWLTGIAKRLKEPERSKLIDGMKNSGNAALKLQFDLLEFEPKTSTPQTPNQPS